MTRVAYPVQRIYAKTLLTASRVRPKGVDEMGLNLDPVVYGKLLATELPKPIENDDEFDRMVARLENPDFADRQLTPEETALREVLSTLIDAYGEGHYDLP